MIIVMLKMYRGIYILCILIYWYEKTNIFHFWMYKNYDIIKGFPADGLIRNFNITLH